jgi:membrane protein YqaA with SNARE-associated domain
MLEFAEFGYWGLFLASFLAATILPFSSEALLSLLLYNNYSIHLCIIFASIGNWMGGMSGYYLGKTGRIDKIEKYFKIDKQKIEKYEQKVEKYGSILAFFCWLPAVGDIIAVALGYFKCKAITVSIYMFLGKILRYIVWGVLTVYVLSA